MHNYDVFYSNLVENKLDSFIDYMWDNCRYRDSWLYDEELIVQNYIFDTKLLVREIKSSIEEKFKKWIFWEIRIIYNDYIEYKLVLFIRSYNITCICKKYVDKKIITIDDINIKS